jgi:hypothetical protein
MVRTVYHLCYTDAIEQTFYIVACPRNPQHREGKQVTDQLYELTTRTPDGYTVRWFASRDADNDSVIDPTPANVKGWESLIPVQQELGFMALNELFTAAEAAQFRLSAAEGGFPSVVAVPVALPIEASRPSLCLQFTLLPELKPQVLAAFPLEKHPARLPAVYGWVHQEKSAQ